MASYTTKAISLKAAAFAEADKLVTLFTRDQGKIKAVAKGARRIPSRLGGRVEPFTYGEYFLAQGRSLDIISQCQVLMTFQTLRESPEFLPGGLYLLRLVMQGTVEGQKYSALFDLLLASLLRLQNKEAVSKVITDFEVEFVKLEGLYREGSNHRYTLSDHIGIDLRTW
jgi:DNA repair protein RecO (recombination protein O)